MIEASLVVKNNIFFDVATKMYVFDNNKSTSKPGSHDWVIIPGYM